MKPSTKPRGRARGTFLRKLSPSEEEIHFAVGDWVRANENLTPGLKWMFHAPNGGLRPHKGKIVAGKLVKYSVQAQKLRRMLARQGVVDLLWPAVYRRSLTAGDGETTILVEGYNGLAIELKSKDGSVTPEQREFLTFLEAQGWQCHVCKSSEVAIALIEAYAAGVKKPAGSSPAGETAADSGEAPPRTASKRDGGALVRSRA